MLTRRTLLRSSVAAATLSGFPACAVTRRTPELEGDLLSSVTDQILQAYPESASSAGIDNGKYALLKSRLTDRSPAGQARIERAVRDTLAQLKRVDVATLPPQRALDVEVVRTVYQTAAEGFDFPFGDVALLNSNWSYRNAPYVVAQNTGAFVELPQFLGSSHSIATKEDADAYVTRMKAYAAQLDGETERVQADGARGVILPDFLMAKTLGQLRGQLSKSVADWGIVLGLAEATKDIPGRHAEAAARIAESEISPAIRRQIAALETLAPRAPSSAGVWAIPDGEAYYAWALKAGTTTTLSPDEVHQMGLEELEALHRQMDPILRDAGYTAGSVGERMIALADDPRYKFAPGDEGRKQIMAFIEEKLQGIRSLMPQAFETLVPGFLEVTRIPEEVEAGAPGAYGGAGSIDGKQPGHFWINLRTTDLHSKYSLPDLTYHEAIPGHVWQGEYTFKQPLIRSLLAFNAYSEGWGALCGTARRRVGGVRRVSHRPARLPAVIGVSRVPPGG